jgi:hypothetical protein
LLSFVQARLPGGTSVGEIDPGGIVDGVEIRWIVKARIGKIGMNFESAPGEIDFAIEARIRERNAYEAMVPRLFGESNVAFKNRVVEILPATEGRAVEGGPVTEGRVLEVSVVTVGRVYEGGIVTEGRDFEGGIVTEARC